MEPLKSFEYSECWVAVDLPVLRVLQHSSTPNYLLCFRSERFGLKRRVAFFQKCFQAAFLSGVFQALVEFFAFGQARHRGQLAVHHPGFTQSHHFKAMSGNMQVDFHRLRRHVGDALDELEAGFQ